MLERSLKIRDFHAEDFETLYEIDHICFPEDIAYSRAELLFCFNHGKSITCVAEADGRIAGFVLARIENHQQAHILTLDVVPETQRLGIGTELMEEVHDILQQWKISTSILEVGTGNLAARRLYEKLGYRCVEVLSGYYSTGSFQKDARSGQQGEHIRPYGVGNGDALRMVRFFNYGLGR